MRSQKYFTAIFYFVASLILSVPAFVFADSLPQNTYFQDQYLHRLTLSGGVGYAKGQESIMNEAGNSWMINSILNSAENGQPMVVPTGDAVLSTYFPKRGFLAYSYGDRFDITFRRHTISQNFDRGGSPAIMFLYPRNTNYATSLFEGIRLMGMQTDSRLYEFGYFHRWTKSLRVGPVVAYHTYIENLKVSYGSYTLRSGSASPDPGLLTWAEGGDARLKYDMKGFAAGVGVKWDFLPDFRLLYNGYLTRRSGDVSGGGFQLIEDRDSSGNVSNRFEGLYQIGSAADQGMLHRLEVEYNYCRWSAALGFEHESWTRSYSSFHYLSNQPRDVSLKSNILGLGEMSTSAAGHRNELYLRVGVSAYLDNGRTAKKSEPAPEKKVEEVKPVQDEKQEEDAVTEESSNYLDKVYKSVHQDYKDKDEILEETVNSFRALGIEVKKQVNDKGLIESLQATIDGDISFKTGSAELTPKALEVVDKFGDALATNPNTLARVHGHTDTPGSKEGNRRLSQRRAESVRSALVSRKGIATERIVEVKGFADDQKIIDTNASEPRNRRTVILIEYKK